MKILLITIIAIICGAYLFFWGIFLGQNLAKSKYVYLKIIIPLIFFSVSFLLTWPIPKAIPDIDFVLLTIGYIIGYVLKTPKPIPFDKKLIILFIAECIIAQIAAMIEHKPMIAELRSMYSLFVTTLLCYLATLIGHEIIWGGKKNNNC